MFGVSSFWLPCHICSFRFVFLWFGCVWCASVKQNSSNHHHPTGNRRMCVSGTARSNHDVHPWTLFFASTTNPDTVECLPHSQLQTSVGEVAHGNPIGSAITSATCLTDGSVGFSCPSLYFLFLFLLPILPLPCAEPALSCDGQYVWISHLLSLPFPSLPPHRCHHLFVARWFTQVLP